MTREQYLQQRATLMTQARAALDEQNLDEYNRLSGEVTALDGRYDALSTAEANFAALGAGGIVPPAVQNLGAGLPGNPGASACPRFHKGSEAPDALAQWSAHHWLW